MTKKDEIIDDDGYIEGIPQVCKHCKTLFFSKSSRKRCKNCGKLL